MAYNLLLEYASGGTLADLIRKSHGKGFLETDVKRYARSILKGLSHMHKLGYVHCDLKPDNVLLVADKSDDGFIAKIGDLGLAKRVDQRVKNDSGRYWRGNPLYFSPEAVVNGVQKPSADIWAFGCKQNVYEAKRTKQEDYSNIYGDGASWFRGTIIGKGSYGSVFVANLNTESRYTSYPSIMAVKSAEVSVSGSLKKEKEVMDNIRGSPYVIKCYDDEITKGENNNMAYNLLLEYASGGTLADLIRKSHGKGFLETDVKRYARSILKADKSDDGFIAKIGDLGLAKRVEQREKNDSGRYWRGNPLYFSPEAVVNGVQKPPADIWAFGCIVFEMLSGNPPWFLYKGLGINKILKRISYEKEIESVMVSAGISEEGKSFLKGCLCEVRHIIEHDFVAIPPAHNDSKIVNDEIVLYICSS
nr:mitogen-activated protein kinase kinase kinase 17-like [Tanacetum cinerariifolium]